jgi:hypothetical protein
MSKRNFFGEMLMLLTLPELVDLRERATRAHKRRLAEVLGDEIAERSFPANYPKE